MSKATESSRVFELTAVEAGLAGLCLETRQIMRELAESGRPAEAMADFGLALETAVWDILAQKAGARLIEEVRMRGLDLSLVDGKLVLAPKEVP